jgi:lipooligosaccharide transport system ATP-binding protein
MADAAIRPKIADLLDFAGLAGKEDANIRTLSGGMKRRLTLARALVNDPELLLLDEPTTGLDPQARHLIWERLKRLLAQGKTILLTTHFMDEAERLCQRLAIIDAGKMVAEGAPRQLIQQHIEAQVVEVYGEDAPGWAEREAHAFSRRVEVSGETAFCYVEDATPLLAHLAAWPALRTLHRPANLEDVFLKLTGRELRD